MQVWEALRYPETVGRGKVIMQGTRFTCVYDYAAQPSQLFTVGNIKQDSFKEEFQGTQGRANVIEISFMNKDKNFERDVLPVFSDDYDASESLSTPTQIELMGCTDLKQAYAHGKHALRANKYELRTCTFDAYVDAIACTIGDVVLLQHDVTEWGSGGRSTRMRCRAYPVQSLHLRRRQRLPPMISIPSEKRPRRQSLSASCPSRRA